MTLVVREHLPADVIGRDAKADSEGPRSCFLLRSSNMVAVAVVAVVVAAMGLLAYLRGVESSSPEAFSGSMIISVEPTRTSTTFVDGQQPRSRHASGPIRLDLLDRRLQGTARVHFSTAVNADSRTSLEDVHLWGDIHLRFDDFTCRGSFAWTNYEEPLEGGGALQTRCRHGATLGATMVATRQPAAADGLVIHLHRGWLVKGRQD